MSLKVTKVEQEEFAWPRILGEQKKGSMFTVTIASEQFC